MSFTFLHDDTTMSAAVEAAAADTSRRLCVTSYMTEHFDTKSDTMTEAPATPRYRGRQARGAPILITHTTDFATPSAETHCSESGSYAVVATKIAYLYGALRLRYMLKGADAHFLL